MIPVTANTAGMDQLSAALTDAPGIATTGWSYDGPSEAFPRAAEDEWAIGFRLDLDDEHRPTLEAWLSFEFLAWVVRDYTRAGRRIEITAESLPPCLNHPGSMANFTLEGSRQGPGGSIDPGEIAATLPRLADLYYVPAQHIDNYYREDQP